MNAKRWRTVRKAFARLLMCEHFPKSLVAIAYGRTDKNCEHWKRAGLGFDRVN